MTPAAARVAVAMALGLAAGTLIAAAAGLLGLLVRVPLPVAALLSLRVAASLGLAVPTYRSRAWRRLSLWTGGLGGKAYALAGSLIGAVAFADVGLHAVAGARATLSVGPLAVSAACLAGAMLALRE